MSLSRRAGPVYPNVNGDPVRQAGAVSEFPTLYRKGRRNGTGAGVGHGSGEQADRARGFRLTWARLRLSEWHFLSVVLMLVDLLALALAAAVAGLVHNDELGALAASPGLSEQVRSVVLYTTLFWALGWRGGIYCRDNLLGGPIEYERVFRACIYTAVAERVVAYLLRLPALPRAWWVTELAFAVFFLVLMRFLVRRVAYVIRNRRGLFATRVLIAGANDQGIAIARQLLWSSGSGFDLVGFVDDYLPAGARVAVGDQRRPMGVGGPLSEDEKPMVLGSTNQLAAIAAEQRVQEVIVIPHAISWEGLQEIVASRSAANGGPQVHLSAGLYDLVTASMTPAVRALVPLLTLGSKRLAGLDAVVKAAFDRAVAGLLFACLWPLASALVAVGWLRGVRPALEWQTVVGHAGRPVSLPLFSRAITNRMLLRGLPSLLYVLRGDLSLVGPRPIAREEASQYGQWEQMLLAVRPGLTGYWRLLADDVSLEEVATWDVWYVRNYSVWTDLYLLFRTGRASLGHGGGRDGQKEAVRRWERANGAAAHSGTAR